jgi:ABC-type lipoprotein release transport system permease subunit
MGRILLVCRLAARDLRHRPASAVLLLLAIATATTTLTLGLALNGTTSHPYDTTRAATAGPDVVAQVTPGGSSATSAAGVVDLRKLTSASGVTSHSGPYPYTFAAAKAGGHDAGALVEGRDEATAPVDQPELTQGSWVRPGEVVVERAFADALGLHAGDRITLDGRSFLVAGIAVTAAIPPYPHICWFGCDLDTPALANTEPGLMWLTRADATALATQAEPLSYVLNLRLASPADASTFANSYDNANPSPSTPYLMSWQGISSQDGRLVYSEQQVLMVATWLLGLLAIASVTVLVSGRMAEQTRRVGLLKAVGSTPGLVATVLLAEHLIVALAAAAIGLLIGWQCAPLLTSPGAGLVGAPGAPPVTLATVGLVVAVALLVAVVATFIPAVRAARTSTVRALADTARAPRRRAWLVAISSRLPVPLLLGLRFAGRRPRRMVLNALSIAVTATGIVAVLIVHARSDTSLGAASGLDNPQTDRLNQVLMVMSVALVLLAAVNAILITWATVLDARHSSALARALGATPWQVTTGLSAAQTLPALAGGLLGIPGGIGLVQVVRHGTGPVLVPPAWWLIAAVLGTVAVVAVITSVPAWLGTRHPAAEVLQAELA